jgi:hypothetical protein
VLLAFFVGLNIDARPYGHKMIWIYGGMLVLQEYSAGLGLIDFFRADKFNNHPEIVAQTKRMMASQLSGELMSAESRMKRITDK